MKPIPTIMFILGVEGLKHKAILMLLLYNTAFVVPLVLIFAAALRGIKSIRLAGMVKENAPLGKLLLFFCYSIFGIIFLFLI